MVEQVGQAELEAWLRKGEGMVEALRWEAGELVTRSKVLLQYARQIESAVKRKGARVVAKCGECGQHRLSKIHREGCGSRAKGEGA